MSEKQGIFLLGLKKSKKREGVTYCIGVFRLGTTNMEFNIGRAKKSLIFITPIILIAYRVL